MLSSFGSVSPKVEIARLRAEVAGLEMERGIARKSQRTVSQRPTESLWGHLKLTGGIASIRCLTIEYAL